MHVELDMYIWNPWYAIPRMFWPTIYREFEITAIECIPKHIFSIKCITNVLYKMTVLYIKDQKLRLWIKRA